MLNARKRGASDPLLPTRQPKHPRVEQTFTGERLSARWAQLTREAVELASVTMMQAWASLSSASLASASPATSSPPRLRHSPRCPPKTHTPPRPSSPNEPYLYARHTRTVQASSLSSDQSSNRTHFNSTGSSLQSAPATGLTSLSHSTVLPRSQNGDALLAESVEQLRRAETVSNTLSRRKQKEHIFARKHKAKVKEDRMNDREAVLKELFDLKRASGFKSNFDDFKSYIDYQARLQHLDDRDVLSPSASLTDLRLKEEDTPGVSYRHSFSSYADIPFLENAKNKLLRTLESPPTKPFSTYEWLRQEARKKDEEIDQRFRPSLPKSLPPKTDVQVDDLLTKRGVIAKIAREQVCDKDLSRLLPCQWLNDEIINFYGAMILERSEACKENPGVNGRKKLLNVHYFNTFFWSKLQGEGYERARLAKWTKKFDIFSKDVVLIPINHNNSHWTGAAINFRRKRIESYDSMNLDRLHVLKSLRHYLDLEHQNKKKKPFDFTGWVNHCPDDTPQQENGYDCGVFTCQFLETLSRGEETFNFSQRDMPYLRRRMIWEIGNAKFLDVP